MAATRCRHPQAFRSAAPTRWHRSSRKTFDEPARPSIELTPLGSLRRYAPSVERVALLATAPAERHADVLDALARLSGKATVLSRTAAPNRGGHRTRAPSKCSSPRPISRARRWCGTPAPTRTCSSLQARATGRGLVFDEARLTDAGRDVPCPTEDDLYRHLGLPYVAPGAARRRRRARSGRAGPAAPAARAAPHPRRPARAHALERRPRHGRADGAGGAGSWATSTSPSPITPSAAPRPARWPASDVATPGAPRSRRRASSVPGIEVLHGVEVDIMPDGSLDFDDELLAGFDIVLASLHDDAGHDGPRLLDRYLRAMRAPARERHHAPRQPDARRLRRLRPGLRPAVRRGGRDRHRAGSGRLARDTSTSTGPWPGAPSAAASTLVMDSDGHRTDLLGRQLQFGVGTARRGWVEPRHVLNTQGIAAVRAFVAAKRGR